MKLFTPKQAKEEYKVKQGVDITQIAYLETTLKKLQLEINRETLQYQQRMKEQRDAYGVEKNALQADLRLLEATVETLRAERERLMIPIDTLKKEAQELHEKAQKRLEEIELQEIEIEATLERITRKLDELSEREVTIELVENQLDKDLQGIKEEKIQVSEGHMRLNLMISTFNQEVDRKTKEINESMVKLEIEKKRAAEYLELRTKELNDQERGLADRRQALEREFERIKKLTTNKKQNGR